VPAESDSACYIYWFPINSLIFKQKYSFTKLPNETLSEILAIYSPLRLTTQR